MAIPTIPPYPVPAECELPTNRVSWQLDPDRAVLLVHDMEEHFVAPYDRGCEPLDRVVPNIARLTAAARRARVPVVYCAQPGGQTPQQRGLQLEWWGAGPAADPAQESVIAELAPHETDYFLTKWRYSAFQRTELRDMLHRWGRDQLVVTGIYAHIGCLLTAAEAFQQDVRAFLPADALADFSAEEHRMALSYAAKRCAAVYSSAQLLAQLEHPAATPVGSADLPADVSTGKDVHDGIIDP